MVLCCAVTLYKTRFCLGAEFTGHQPKTYGTAEEIMSDSSVPREEDSQVGGDPAGGLAEREERQRLGRSTARCVAGQQLFYGVGAMPTWFTARPPELRRCTGRCPVLTAWCARLQ